MALPDAVIFDIDGTLIDSEHIWDDVRKRLARDDSRPWPAEASGAMMGMSTPEWAGYMADIVGIGTSSSYVAARVIDEVGRAYRDELPVIPGAPETVRRLAGLCPVGFASSSPRVLIDLLAEELGVADVLSVTVSTEEVGAGKPAPDGYLRACELLGADPAWCVAVEDSANGLRSAVAAGMKVVHVPPRLFAPPPEVAAIADVILGSITDLDADVLASLMTPAQRAARLV